MCILKRSRRIFNDINSVVFNQHLPPIKFCLTKEEGISGCFEGISFYHAYNELENRAIIRINKMYNKLPSQLFDTIAHEMCHYVQFLHGYKVNHKNIFVDIMLEIEENFQHELITDYRDYE